MSLPNLPRRMWSSWSELAEMPLVSEEEIQRYTPVADILADGNAPKWFTKNLCILGREAMPGFRDEATRNEDRQTLLHISNQATDLPSLFSDRIVTRLVQEAPWITQYLPSLLTQWPMLRQVAKQAADKIKTGPGAEKAIINGKPSAKEFCALVVREGWALFHSGKPPGLLNEKAQRAADMFWELSGGQLGEKLEATWRLHMERVRGHGLRGWVSEKLQRLDWGD